MKPLNIDHEAGENATPEVKAYYDNKKLFFRNAFWFIFGSAAATFGFNTSQTLMPLHMQKVGLNPEQIGMIMSARWWIGIPLILYISHLTDHWQGKRGRRTPFLILSLPFMVAGMIFFPFVGTAVGCLVVFTIFAFFMQVKYDTYPLLVYDVAKYKYWGRMAGVMLVMGNLATWLGQVVLMPMTETHGEKTVYLLTGVILFFATILTIVFVKEPPIVSSEPPMWNPLPVIKATLRVGFSDKRNIWLFLAYALSCGPWVVLNNIALQARVNLHMTDGDIGKHVLAYGTLAATIVAIIVGWTIDKIGPVKAICIGYVLFIASAIIGFNPESPQMLAIASRIVGFTPEPSKMLATGFVLASIASAFMYTAILIFVVMGVERKNLAAFAACSGSVNLCFQAILIQVSGSLIMRVFGGNYGASFLIAGVSATLCMPLLFTLQGMRKRSAADELRQTEAELTV